MGKRKWKTAAAMLAVGWLLAGSVMEAMAAGAAGSDKAADASAGAESGKTEVWIGENGAAYVARRVNGKAEGPATIYYMDGKKLWSKFEGICENGAPSGPGVLTWADGAKLMGTWKDDQYHGTVVWYDAAGTLRYAGESAYNKWDGYGVYFDESGTCVYAGEYSEGQWNGYGICFYEDGSFYSGEWINGIRKGRGSLFSSSYELIQNGYWENDECVRNEETGIFIWSDGGGSCDREGDSHYGFTLYENGDRYFGGYAWDEGDRIWKRNGFGIYIWSDGSVYAGNWDMSVRCGECVWVTQFADQEKEKSGEEAGAKTWQYRFYIGEAADGNYDGRGVYYDTDGSSKSGIWKEGEFQGREEKF